MMVWLLYPSNDNCAELLGIQEAESFRHVAQEAVRTFGTTRE